MRRTPAEIFFLQDAIDNSFLEKAQDVMEKVIRYGGVMAKWNGESIEYLTPDRFVASAADGDGHITGSIFLGKSPERFPVHNGGGTFEFLCVGDYMKLGISIEDSIADHSAYLLGAINGKKLRYDGLKGCVDYEKAVQIIKDGGYATSLTYVEKL